MHNLIKCPPVGIISRQEQKMKITKATTEVDDWKELLEEVDDSYYE